MDAFYASIEQRDDPALRGRPVAVGGGGRRGVVAAASYEARRYGVHSAMPGRAAAQQCPELVFVKPRFEVYRAVSQQIRAIFARYTALVEPLSLDEAFLDVTEPRQGPPSATLIAQAIRAAIRAETGLTASAGVSFNKFLAKVASDVHKPDGLTVIRPEEAPAFLDALPIERFYGVGPATARRLHTMGVRTGSDLRQCSRERLAEAFGKRGLFYYDIVRGEDDRPVRPHREPKSIGAERTFAYDLQEVPAMARELAALAGRVAERLGRHRKVGRCVVLKVRDHTFETHTRQTTVGAGVQEAAHLFQVARHLLEGSLPARPVRLLGVTVKDLADAEGAAAGHQLVLPFPESGGRGSCAG